MNRFKEVSALKGKVEFVDYVSSTIRFETNEIVCWALCYGNNGIFVPSVGDVITILHLHLDTLSYPKEYYIDANGTILLNPTAMQREGASVSTPTFAQSELSALVHRYNIKLAQLWSYRNLYPNFINLRGICADGVDAIKLCLLTKLLDHCGGTFKIIKVVTAENLHYTSEGSIYKFGNYINCFRRGEDNECVIGLLSINNENGTYELTDGKRVLPCLISASDDEPKKKFDNEIVMIIRYVMLGEIYARPPVRQSYEYLHVLQSDIVQLKLTSLMEPNLFNFLSATAPSRFADKITFKLKNVSLPISNEDKSTNFWVEIENEDGSCLLCFGWEYSMTLSLLQMGCIYNLYLKVKLKPYHDAELNRVCKQSFKVFSSSAVFVKERTERMTYLTVQEVCQRMTDLNSSVAHRNSKIHINFEGVIDSKQFNGRQTSRTNRNIEGKDFGTPGDISHSVKFRRDGSKAGCASFILYLNNWERKLYQRGLVARMRVRVRCAELTNRYLRSNAMTSFSILGLADVPDDIKTANLNESNPRIIYGSLGNLGLQCNVVMRTRVKVLNTQECRIETNQDGSIHFSLNLFVLGPSEALLRCSCKQLLSRLLNCGKYDDDDDDRKLNEWKEMFECCGPIALPNNDRRWGDKMCNIIKMSLNWRLKMLNWMDVVTCSRDTSFRNLPVWDLLEFVGFE